MKNIKKIISILILLIMVSSCADSGKEHPNEFGPLKYVITNISDNIIDTVYLHSNYYDYKSGIINPKILNKGDKFNFCPKSNMYLTFRRNLSKDDHKKIYVTTSKHLSYESGIIQIDLGDADFFVNQSRNPSSTCTIDIESCDDVVCSGREICDPSTKICVEKCKYVTCEHNKECNPLTGKCIGKCENVICEENKSCDPLDGICYENINSIFELRKYGATLSKDGTIKGEKLIKDLEGVVTAIYMRNNKILGFFVSQIGITEYSSVYVSIERLENSINITKGDVVKFNGEHFEVNGFSTVIINEELDIEIISKTVLPAPIKIGISEFDEKYESVLVELKNEPFIVTSPYNLDIEPKKYDTDLEDINGESFKMQSALYFPYYNLSKDTSLNKIIGILSYKQSIYKILPRNEDDLLIVK